MFWFLGAALFVDGIDGTLARRLDVAERLPRWSGDMLDLVVDFLTYVFMPAYVVVASGLLPAYLAIPCAVAIIISGALYFADRRMKTDGQLLPRLSGGVERAGVLSACCSGPIRGSPRPPSSLLAVATFLPGSVRPSVPRRAAARADHDACLPSGRCSRVSHCCAT